MYQIISLVKHILKLALLKNRVKKGFIKPVKLIL